MRGREVTVPAAVSGAGGRRAMRLVEAPYRPSVGEVVALNGFRLLGRLLRALLAHPFLAVSAGGLWWLIATVGLLVTVAGFVVLALVLILARWRWPVGFERQVTYRVRTATRRVWVYDRCWRHALTSCGLVESYGERTWVPELRRVKAHRHGDAVLVQILAGHDPEQWEARTSALAHAFGSTGCRVTVDRPGRLWLHFTRRDPLAPLVPPRPIPDVVDPTAVDLGLVETRDGSGVRPWLLRLLGTHVLIAGATGSGKGSVIWSLLRGLSPGIRDGSVQVWAVDPKGGMELAPGASMFARFAYRDHASMVGMLEDACVILRERADRLRAAGLRLHQPTVAEPLIVVVVDELAALVSYGTDRDHKRRAEAALAVLLSQGRAPGVVVVAAVQDPSKEVLPLRDLFPTRIALRLVEDTQVDMVLGRGARARGAECDRIPPSLPGVGYVLLEGQREPARVRAAYLSDANIADLAATTPAPITWTGAGRQRVDLSRLDIAQDAAA